MSGFVLLGDSISGPGYHVETIGIALDFDWPSKLFACMAGLLR